VFGPFLLNLTPKILLFKNNPVFGQYIGTKSFKKSLFKVRTYPLLVPRRSPEAGRPHRLGIRLVSVNQLGGLAGEIDLLSNTLGVGKGVFLVKISLDILAVLVGGFNMKGTIICLLRLCRSLGFEKHFFTDLSPLRSHAKIGWSVRKNQVSLISNQGFPYNKVNIAVIVCLVPTPIASLLERLNPNMSTILNVT
jgi:hypothetical protein